MKTLLCTLNGVTGILDARREVAVDRLFIWGFGRAVKFFGVSHPNRHPLPFSLN